jgi:hypothetical protein
MLYVTFSIYSIERFKKYCSLTARVVETGSFLQTVSLWQKTLTEDQLC